jgi:hypothetical protein
MFYSRLDLTKKKTQQKRRRRVYVRYSTTFSIRRILTKSLFIYNHRHVDLTTASNTVTSSGLPPQILIPNDLLALRANGE